MPYATCMIPARRATRLCNRPPACGPRACRRATAEALERRCLLSAGQPDSTFGIGGRAAGALFPGGGAGAVALQGDGKIIAVGSSASLEASMGGFALARFNSNGSLDRTFGTNGRTTTSSGQTMAALATSVAIQRDGKIVVAGYDYTLSQDNTVRRFMVARYLPGGRLDASFGAAGIVTLSFGGSEAIAQAVGIQPGGRIVVAGGAAPPGGAFDDFALAGLTPSGKLDKTFGVGGEILAGFPASAQCAVNSLIIQRNGDILTAGESVSQVASSFVLARYQPNGKLDAAFGTSGSGMSILPNPNFAATSIAMQTDGKILAGGPADNARMEVVRFLPTGTVDKGFGIGGAASVSAGDGAFTCSVLVKKGGRIVAVGNSSRVLSEPKGPGRSFYSLLIAGFTPAGAVDKSFGNSGTIQTPMPGNDVVPKGAALQPDGRVVVLGETGNSDAGTFVGNDFSTNVMDFALARYTLSGKLDDTFGYHGTVQRPDGITGAIRAIAVQRDGKIVIAGSELSPGPHEPTDAALARYNPDGSLDTSFGIDGRVILRIGNNAAYDALAIMPDGDIVAGGYGQAASSGPGASTDVFAVVRYNPDGSGDQSFGAGGEVLTSFGAGGQRCSSVAVQPNGDIVAAGSTFDASGNPLRMAVARYLAGGALDPAFGIAGQVILNPKGLGGQVNSLALQKDGKIVLGGSTGPDFGVVRLTAAGRLDSSFGTGGVAQTAFPGVFDPNPSLSQIDSLTLDASGNIVVAGGIFIGPGVFPIELALARYLPNGKLDPAFATGGKLVTDIALDGQLIGLALQRDGKLVVAGSAEGNGDEGTMVARFTSKGLDPTFGTAGIADLSGGFGIPVPASAVAIGSDGNILAGGFDLFRLTGK